MDASGQSGRINQLDGLRGVAALIVLFHHIVLSFPGYATANAADLAAWHPLALIKFSPLRVLVAGSPAVLLFFCLSGFVLSLALLRGGRVSIGRYALKRIVRLWPPFAVAIVFAACLYLALPEPPKGVSRWAVEEFWNAPLTPWVLAKHLLMFGTPPNQMLDPPMWSLVHEIRIALIFPLLFCIVRWAPVAMTALLWILAIGASFAIQGRPSDYVQSYVSTGMYLCLFAAGVTLAIHRRLSAIG